MAVYLDLADLGLGEGLVEEVLQLVQALVTVARLRPVAVQTSRRLHQVPRHSERQCRAGQEAR